MCHTNFNQLNVLFELIDDVRNDIYLHIDKKSKGFSSYEIKKHIQKSNLFFVDPIKVGWGGDSQIKAELRLLKEAVKTKHQYYHLISGMDLPLKTQDEIHSFFFEHSGTDFVAIEKDHPHNATKLYMDRLRYYYFFQNKIGYSACESDNHFNEKQNKSIKRQKALHIDRTKNKGIKFVKGSNWFSITHNTACYVVQTYKKFSRVFKYTYCADEIFLQTILAASPFNGNIEDNNLRYVDWDRRESNAHPHIFRDEDFDALINADGNKLFARKFDEKTDPVIIKRIYNYLKNKAC